MKRLRGRGDIVERFVRDAAGEGGVAGDGDDMLVRARLVAAHGHAERGGEGRAGVPGAVAVVLALAAQQEPVQAIVLAHGVEAVPAAGEELVHVALVAHVEDELVLRRVEDTVQRDGQLDHAEVRPEVAADGAGVILGQNADQFLAHFLGENGQVGFIELLDIGGRIDLVEKTHGNKRGFLK